MTDKKREDMSELKIKLDTCETGIDTEKSSVVASIQAEIVNAGYEIAELNADKPWGAYFRFNGAQADMFVEEFFPGLSASEARLGDAAAELSPKILLVSPGERLSWQYHDRRAERWAFLSPGAYNKSQTDDPGELVSASPGDVVQFAMGERHRLVGATSEYTIVAEIWQHTDANNPSNEADIVRLQDDYSR